jgi:peptide chain release factor 2
MRRLSQLRDLLQPLVDLEKNHQDIEELSEMLSGETNPELEQELDRMINSFLAELDRFELQTLLAGEHDAGDAIVEIKAGAGGTEACDWAQMLFRMYSRWAERRGYQLELLSETPGDQVGFRSVSFQLKGDYAYGYSKAEAGVHRLVRISPYDASGRRHTSFAKVEVLPVIEESEVNIDPEDLKVDTLRASGAGGQHVNKTESAVRITHIPTGVVVTAQSERSQHKNRASAMAVLASRLAELQRVETEEERRALKGDLGPAEWGNQIRSYVLQPYTMVKDVRTQHETGNILGVLDGDIDDFVQAFLKKPRQDS